MIVMFNVKKTLEVLEQTALKYDATLGFAEHIGFRRGTCFPFYLYDFKRKQISTILEFPLIIMDTTLIHAKYMKISQHETLHQIEPLIAEVKKFHGVLSVLWHNTSFSDYKYTGWKKFTSIC